MALPQTFQIGDQVRMLRSTNGLAKGLCGTVVQVVAATGCCDVQFDRYDWSRLVYRHDLELLTRANTTSQKMRFLRG
jgi:hypothetical protein